jgi:hypothetical protein
MVIKHGHGLPVHVAHEARIRTALLFVKRNQPAAQFGLEHTGKRKHRCPVIPVGVGFQPCKRVHRCIDRIEFETTDGAQPTVEKEEKRAIGGIAIAAGPIFPADASVVIEEIADSGDALRYLAAGCIVRIGGYPEKACAPVIENVGVISQSL